LFGGVQTVELAAAVIATVALFAYPIVIRLVEKVPQGIREEAARAYFDEHGHWPDEED
jgi:hypothetical protein